jgi:predicted nucleic acid-binding protein
MKVFLDINVWLSATIFPGLCEELVQQCAERGWVLTSALVRAEAHEVLARKFPQVPHAAALFDAVWEEASLIEDQPEPADDNDRRLVAAARAAGATLFVTGDKRVLSWQMTQQPDSTMQIVSPREAWGILFGGEGGH